MSYKSSNIFFFENWYDHKSEIIHAATEEGRLRIILISSWFPGKQ